MQRLSTHFTRHEFACKGALCCNHSAPIHPLLVEALQRLRYDIEKPIHILSGFRCRKHNANVGGAPDSYHTYGMAADILVKGMSPAELAAHAEGIKTFGGIGIYPSWVHLDVREDPARW